jgi:hypothetical protein
MISRPRLEICATKTQELVRVFSSVDLSKNLNY